ncbi:MAG: AIPR family protein, partial [Anaerolineales bacterium]|nr:AIPR family protein [Anaerolineales bacterium]
FVANVAANAHATKYLEAAAKAGTAIDLWDLTRLAPILAQLDREWYVDHPISLRISKGKLFFDGPKAAPRLVYAAIPAKELVRLPGISDTRLFAQNVRLGLGKTRVNKEIIEAVRDPADHASFLAFHNGLTLVAKYLRIKDGSIRMNNYCVCNGCQSLLAFYNNRGALTDAIEVLVRIVKVTRDRALADDIAYRTNNQNPVSLRDLHSNDETQLQLRAEFDASYGCFATYSIKRGEPAPATELSNEYAGRLLLALQAREPWSSHQKYRVFGDLQDKIFRYGISAHHIRLAQLISEQVQQACAAVSMERVRDYSLTAFVVLYLVGEMLRESADGLQLLKDPTPYLSTSEHDNPMQAAILAGVRDLALAAVAELNYYVQDHGADAYDYKSEFKSPTRVQQIRAEVLKAYQKDVFRSRATHFALPTAP